jgi:hypothetical protein
MVERAIGKVPTNNDWVGCRIITVQISGYIVYLKIEMQRKKTKRSTFEAKMATEIQ